MDRGNVHVCTLPALHPPVCPWTLVALVTPPPSYYVPPLRFYRPLCQLRGGRGVRRVCTTVSTKKLHPRTARAASPGTGNEPRHQVLKRPKPEFELEPFFFSFPFHRKSQTSLLPFLKSPSFCSPQFTKQVLETLSFLPLILLSASSPPLTFVYH